MNIFVTALCETSTDGRTDGADGADRYLGKNQNRGSDLDSAPNDCLSKRIFAHSLRWYNTVGRAPTTA